MARLIDADELRKYLINESKDIKPCGKDNFYKYGFRCGLVMIANELKKMPAVDAMPVVHGHWISDKNEILYGRICRCSVCGNYVVTDDIDITRTGIVAAAHNPFCRWCGAKMDKEDGEQE